MTNQSTCHSCSDHVSVTIDQVYTIVIVSKNRLQRVQHLSTPLLIMTEYRMRMQPALSSSADINCKQNTKNN